MQWGIVGRYFASPEILSGLVVTVELTAGSQVIATVLGILLAMMGQSHSLLLRSLSRGYIWLFRATPLLVQLLFWYNIALVFPNLSLGVPFTRVHLFNFVTSALISGLTASFLALGLNEAAYMA
ncbi:MAG: ABC transporter permease subunit, partial [Acidimicrobiales bacterium]